MKKQIKYIKVSNGKLSILQTNNFNEAIKNSFGSYFDFDSSDYIFDEDLDIRVFLKANSTFLNLEETIYYYVNNELVDINKGIVLFAKNGNRSWKSLSNKDINIIKKRLKPSPNNTFSINY